MTRDEVIRLAREASDPNKVDAWHNGFWTVTQEELELFAELVAKHEREECAKVAEETKCFEHEGSFTVSEYICVLGGNAADAIRARSTDAKSDRVE